MSESWRETLRFEYGIVRLGGAVNSPSRHLVDTDQPGSTATPEGVWFKPHERNSNP